MNPPGSLVVYMYQMDEFKYNQLLSSTYYSSHTTNYALQFIILRIEFLDNPMFDAKAK